MLDGLVVIWCHLIISASVSVCVYKQCSSLRVKVRSYCPGVKAHCQRSVESKWRGRGWGVGVGVEERSALEAESKYLLKMYFTTIHHLLLFLCQFIPCLRFLPLNLDNAHF